MIGIAPSPALIIDPRSSTRPAVARRGNERLPRADVRRGLNTVDFGRFKNRVVGRSGVSDSMVFMSPPSGFRDVIFGPVAFAFNDASIGMMQEPVE